MVVTAHGESREVSELDVVRLALLQAGFTHTKPSDDWIRYYLRQGFGVGEIVEIAYGRPLTASAVSRAH